MSGTRVGIGITNQGVIGRQFILNYPPGGPLVINTWDNIWIGSQSPQTRTYTENGLVTNGNLSMFITRGDAGNDYKP
jgi:hypothetical protein